MDIAVDKHKLVFHPKRVAEWHEKGDCFPVYVEAGLTNACNHNCVFCALDFLENGARFIDRDIMVSAIKDMGQRGVKSMMIAGEGESVLHKDIGLFSQTAKQSGMDVSITTNGVPFTTEKIRSCMPNLTWIRFSIDSGSPENYAQVHQCAPEDFNRVINNIQEAVEFKKQNNLKTTIGVQFLMIPPNKDEVIKLAHILKEVGADNLQVKPYSHHPQSKNDFSVDPLHHDKIEKELQQFNSDKFQVIFRKNTIERLQDRPYDKCFGASFISLIDAMGNIFPCNLFYNSPEFVYGNLYEKSFSDIWRGDKRKQILEKLKVGHDCRAACRLDVINRYLHRLKNPGLHENFI